MTTPVFVNEASSRHRALVEVVLRNIGETSVAVAATSGVNERCSTERVSLAQVQLVGMETQKSKCNCYQSQTSR